MEIIKHTNQELATTYKVSNNSVTGKILSAQQSKLIEHCTDAEIAMLILFCMTLTGFKVNKLTDEDKIERNILIDFIKTNFSKITIDEVKLAFNFAIMNVTDAEIRHFQSFSASYVAEVINTYQKRKVIALESYEKNVQENKLLPAVVISIEEKQKDEYEGLVNFIQENKYLPIGWNWVDAFFHATRIGLINDSDAFKANYFNKISEEIRASAKEKKHHSLIKQYLETHLNDTNIIFQCRKRRLIDYLTEIKVLIN